MKRDSALVTYSSSDESETDCADPPAKKRKLPLLSPTLLAPAHVDDPALHQGRLRTTPHVDGQFSAHIYLLRSVIASAKNMVPALHDFWVSSDSEPELHISLSRPIYLRAHQREDIKRTVKHIAETNPPFTVSFAELSELVNDERTRIFLALEVGSGHHELASITNSITPALRNIRQQEFYASPRFHASIGWALLDSSVRQGSRSVSAAPASYTNPSSSIGADSSDSAIPLPRASEFPTITAFPPKLLSTLNRQYGPSLTGSTVKSFDITEISVKVGKDVSRWHLTGV
ncbi:U6 snRNA phosphodiesterase Usb1 [Mycena rebaudengoi]|nr:U6 snRNA phosphodiesterase Usb1 [Mycena rebaudengoi]